MDRIAQFLWDPFLCIVYLAIGIVFLVLTGAAAWRRSLSIFGLTWSSGTGRTTAYQVGHKDAFISALAASIGVGNLAGVATAIHLGGPGALFWIWISALFGMSFRMSATYLAIEYRPENSADLSFATPMAYLEKFFPIGLAKTFAILILVSGLVNANLIQSNSVAHSLTMNFGFPRLAVAGLAMAAVALVVLFGMKSIVRVSVLFAPWMLIAYLGAGIAVLASDPNATLSSLGAVFDHAFRPYSLAGGVAGYAMLASMQYGVSRGVFSHGSGIGVAPFFQSANADHPARGAYMAALVPLFDTLIVCTITGLVVLSKGYWQLWTGAHLTVSAFENALGTVGKDVVFGCLIVFALTTVVGWAHFSERCFEYLGGKNLIGYRALFCAVTFLGPFFPVALVWSLADVLVGLLLIVHLLPLTYIVARRAATMQRDLLEFDPRTSRAQARVAQR
jgi:AGCS family alanine or glycine:cation symporter